MFYGEAALVVLFNDPLRKAQAQAPATLFGGKTGFEDPAYVLAADPFARVGHVDQDIPFRILDAYIDGAFALHGIQRIF